jgi:hypothetical protein
MNTSPFQFVADSQALTDAGTLVVRVSSRIRRKRELFGVLRKQLRLPGYCGGNWDALNDCLRDLSWLEGVSRVVLWHDGLPFAPDSSSRSTYLELLHGLVTDPPTGTPTLTVAFPPSAAVELSSFAQ